MEAQVIETLTWRMNAGRRHDSRSESSLIVCTIYIPCERRRCKRPHTHGHAPYMSVRGACAEQMWTEEISTVRMSFCPSVDLKTTKMLWDHRPRGLHGSWFSNPGKGCGGARA